MEFRKNPIALAALALCAAAPFGAEAAPTVSFKTPLAGATLGSVNYYQSSSCEVSGTNIKRVAFSIVSSSGAVTQLNTENNAPWNCNLNTANFADGAYTLRAVAYDSANATATATRSITINKSGTTSGGTTNSAPVVTFLKPATGTNVVAGNTVACEVTAADADGIAKVEWLLDGVLKSTETSSPYNFCNVGALTAGTHVITARATDKKGAVGQAQATVTAGSTSGGTSGGTTAWAQFVAPASGGVITGDANGAVTGLPKCGVSGTGISRVDFYMNDVQTNYDMNGSNGWGCYFNTNNYTAGTHTLKAVVTNTSGQKLTLSQPVVIEGTTTTPTNPAPVVTFLKPATGTSVVAGNTVACEVTASDADGIAKVEWLLDGVVKSTETSSPYNFCNVGALSAGTHVIKARATDKKGAVGEAQVSVTAATTSGDNTSGGGTASPISSADIMTMATADQVFSTQPDVVVDVLGSTVWLTSIPESGRHGTMLSNGETLRFGKENDPAVIGRKAMTFQLVNTDPNTGGSKRTEIAFPRELEMNKVYWLAVSVMVDDWGTLSTSDNSLFGFQVHSGTKLDLSPQLTLLTSKNGRHFRVMTRWSTSSTPTMSNSVSAYYAEQPIPFGQWMDFVIKFKQNTQGQGFAQVYMNGQLIADHKGNLGYDTPGFKDFVKWGYYNWTSSFNSVRKVRLRSPMIVADPTGSKYRMEDFQAVLGPRSGTLTSGTTSGTTTSASSGDSGLCTTITCAAQ
jgi:hypothetical protein